MHKRDELGIVFRLTIGLREHCEFIQPKQLVNVPCRNKERRSLPLVISRSLSVWEVSSVNSCDLLLLVIGARPVLCLCQSKGDFVWEASAQRLSPLLPNHSHSSRTRPLQ